MSQKDQSYFEANKSAWNLRAGVHKDSDFYQVEAWKKGATSLQEIELRELGDVDGKTLLHLQCHFGQDTLSWARKGAVVTGMDLSDVAIATAKSYAEELNIPASFICCNVYDLEAHLEGSFDVVFSSYGVIGWLPDLDKWAGIVAKYLKPGGCFYLAEFHPVVWMMDEEFGFLKYPYDNKGVIATDNEGTYADEQAPIQYRDYSWNHSLSEVINSLLKQGLRLEFLNEYDFSPYNCFSNTVQISENKYQIKGLEGIIPMVYSLKAVK